MQSIEHSCPHSDCGVRLTTTLRPQAPAPSYGVTSIPVKCPSCSIKFGLWVPMNLAGYVDKTLRAPTLH
jgi:hypothetical protein